MPEEQEKTVPSPQSKSPAKRRRRRRRKPPSQPKTPALSPEKAALDVLKALQNLGDALLHQQGVTAHQLPQLLQLHINVPMGLGPGAHLEHGALAKQLITRLDARLKESLTAKVAYVRGTVFCHRCETATCEHASPPDPIHTFSGYAPTGQPQWVDLPNLFINFGDDRVNRLYQRTPDVLGLMLLEIDLASKLLPVFTRGDGAYRILGQVSAGLISTNFHPPKPGSDVLALTAQIIETRGPKGTPRLRMNILGTRWDLILEAAAESEPRDPPERLRRAIKQAMHNMDKIGRRMAATERNNKTYDPGEDVERILLRLKADLERMFTRNRKRTIHAHERHLQVSRPTGNALSDAKKASQERLLFDIKKETIVVLGPRGRVHLFSEDARHVTSLTLQPGDLDRRLSRGRWRMLSLQRSMTFKLKLSAYDAPEAEEL